MIIKNTKIYYNLSHLTKVLDERKIKYPQKEIVNDHYLFNFKLKSVKTGKIYEIESIQKHWLFGWYYIALIACDKSHAVVVFENINCDVEEIKECIVDFKNEFVII